MRQVGGLRAMTPARRPRVRRGVAGLVAAVVSLSGLAVLGVGVARAVVVGGITTYTDPSNNIAGPYGIAPGIDTNLGEAGLDGNEWFTSAGNNRIGKITPTGTVTTYTDPNIKGPAGITFGPGGMWFTSSGNNRIGNITLSGAVTTYADPNNNISDPVGITLGPDQNLWFTSAGNNRIGMINPMTGMVTTYTDPNISAPEEITQGPDGNLWFTSAGNNRIGKITPAGTVATYTDPNISNPKGITDGNDGNVWFTNLGNNRIGKINVIGTVTTYTDPNISAPEGIYPDFVGNVWFTSYLNNRIGEINTTTGTVTTYTDPNIKGPFGIVPDLPGEGGNVWFTSLGNNRIGEVQSGRIAGNDAIGTAIAVSQTAFPAPGSASAVVLARSDFFSDALAGGPLAAKVGGPMLITPGASLFSGPDPRVLAEIQRVLPAGKTVYVLGGPLALSPGVDAALTSAGYVVKRLQGANEFATAVAIANQLGNPLTIFEATGLDFPDALSAVPAAIHAGGAILLTDGTTQAPETAADLAAHPPTTRYAIGGPLAAYGADPTAIPVYGATLFGTSSEVANTFFPHAAIFGVATGLNYPDALAGGVFMATAGRLGPVLLVGTRAPLPASIAAYLATLTPATQGYVFGGYLAVFYDVIKAIDAAL